MNRFSPSSANPIVQRFQGFAWAQPGTIGLTILLAILSFVVLSPIYLLLVSGVQVEGVGNVTGYSLAAWRAAFSEPASPTLSSTR
jgi:hypothetical protein